MGGSGELGSATGWGATMGVGGLLLAGQLHHRGMPPSKFWSRHPREVPVAFLPLPEGVSWGAEPQGQCRPSAPTDAHASFPGDAEQESPLSSSGVPIAAASSQPGTALVELEILAPQMALGPQQTSQGALQCHLWREMSLVEYSGGKMQP